MSLRTPLGRARGLGTAKDGVHHWWMQRVTAIALVPLSVWFIAMLVQHAGADHQAAMAIFQSPLNALLTITLLFALFYHGQLGIQVVVEDYIHDRALSIGLLIAVKFLAFLFAGAGVLAVIRLSLGAS